MKEDLIKSKKAEFISEEFLEIECKNKNEYFYWLDLLRALAAFVVVITHFRSDLFVEYGSLPESNKTILVSVFYFFTRLAHESVMLFLSLVVF